MAASGSTSAPVRFRARTCRLTDANPQLSGPLADAIGYAREPVAKWYFDFSLRRCLPSHLFDDGDPSRVVSDRMVRRDLWAKFGQPMHFMSLKFQDPAVEAEFVLDMTRRNKRWVEYCVLARLIASLWLLTLASTRRQQDQIWKSYLGAAGCVDLLQYLQIQFDRQFVKDYFQRVILFWVSLQAVLLLIYASQKLEECAHNKRGMSEQVEMFAVFSALFLISYRMRFSHFAVLLVLLYTSCTAMLLGFAALRSEYELGSCMPHSRHMRYSFFVPGTMLCINYALELLQRKDFIQVSMVWKESRRSNMLLGNILPEPVIEQLKSNPGSAVARSYKSVTVVFADVVSFTTMSAQISPEELVKLLNRMFLKFDDIASALGVEKIKTIGDCYMAAAGLPNEDPNHAVTMARFGLQMLAAMEIGIFRNPASGEPVRVRAGIHSGPAVAGVLGYKKFAYDLWGDAVNTASRMESHGFPMRLHCSEDTYKLLRGTFLFEAREPMYVKGKGEMQTYFVLEEKPTKVDIAVQGPLLAATPNGGDGDDAVEERGRHSSAFVASMLDKAKGFSRKLSSMGSAPISPALNDMGNLELESR